MKCYCFLWFLVLISINSSLAHPVHISVTSIEIFQDTKEIKLLIKAPKDDLELALFHNYEFKFDYLNEDLKDLDKDLINQYFTQKFYIKSKKVKEYVLIGVDFADENYYLKYSIKLKQIPSKLILVNTIFNDINFNQKNLIIIKYSNYEKGFELDNFNTTFELNLKEINQ
ncbi:DUF6702 family protein [Bacteroidota bacterium]